MISERAKRVVIYTASLLAAPLPVMPYEKGTRAFAVALIACGFVLTLASLYVVRGELRLKARSMLGTKMLAVSLITLFCGTMMIVGSIIYLSAG